MKKLLVIFVLIWTTQYTLFSQTDTLNLEKKIETPESLNKNNDEELFTYVGQMPIFDKSCEKTKYLEKCNMVLIREYLDKAKDSRSFGGTKERAYITFIVEKDGSVSNIKILRGDKEELDSLDIQHLQNMPKFYKPGKQRGKPVRVLYKVPILF